MTHVQPELAPTKVIVSDLIDAAGASRPVQFDVATPKGFDVPLTTFADVTTVDGVLEALLEGILVRGTVEVDVTRSCARCLEPMPEATEVVDVAELFSDPATAEEPGDVEEGYEIAAGSINIDALLRDALAQATPTAPLCREDCAGLCPTCGINRNDASCECADEPGDDRWAALSDLKLNP
ncbi:YceD family protein [soil metagenome]